MDGECVERVPRRSALGTTRWLNGEAAAAAIAIAALSCSNHGAGGTAPGAADTELTDAFDGPDATASEDDPEADDEPAAAATPTYRAIAGVSMGGFGAAHLGTAHPELFDVVACHGGLVDMTYFLWLLETHFLGGFRGEDDIEFSFEALPTDPDVRLDRDAYVIDFFQDFTRGLGNFATYNPESPYYPPGVDAADIAASTGRGDPGVVVAGCFDDEYNPSETLPAIPFYDGGDQDPEGVFDDPGDRLGGLLGLVLGPAMAQGRMQKMIVVLPDGRTPDGRVSAFVNMVVPPDGDSGRYRDAITLDLIPHIDGAYRTRYSRVRPSHLPTFPLPTPSSN